MRSSLAVLGLFVVGVTSCSGGNNSITNLNDLGAQQCSWPSSLDDAGPGGCTAARALVNCTDSSGDVCSCLSDSQRCPACGSSYSSCHDQCAPNEYAVACGSIGPSAQGIANPPAGCTTKLATPAGVIDYCCPCQ